MSILSENAWQRFVTQFGPRVPAQIELSAEAISTLKNWLETVAPGLLSDQERSLARAKLFGNYQAGRQHALAWSIEQHENIYKSSDIHNLSDKDVHFVFNCVYSVCEIYNRWRDHPDVHLLVQRFANPSELFHSALQLQLSAILWDGGVPAVWRVDPSARQREADLSVLYTPDISVRIEVKAPEVLRFSSAKRDRISFERLVKNCISSAKGQFSRNKPGLVAIVAGAITDDEEFGFVKAADAYLNKFGTTKDYLCGIMLAKTFIVSDNPRYLTDIAIRTRVNGGLATPILLNPHARIRLENLWRSVDNRGGAVQFLGPVIKPR